MAAADVEFLFFIDTFYTEHDEQIVYVVVMTVVPASANPFLSFQNIFKIVPLTTRL